MHSIDASSHIPILKHRLQVCRKLKDISLFSLLQLDEGHRYLVSNNYKIVYKNVIEGVLITDVFDTRQDPIKINNPNRKPSR